MFLLPTRGRPEQVIGLIKAMAAVGNVPEVAVMIDDDPKVYAGVPWPEHWHVHVAPEHLEMAGALNKLYELYPGQPWYAPIPDHMRPQTRGWVEKMVAAAGEWNIAYCADDWRNGARLDDRSRPRICGAVVLGGKLVEKLGWIVPPFLKHLYVDDVLEAIGERHGLMRFVPDVLCTTERRSLSPDRTHKGEAYAERDRAAWQAWEREGATLDLPVVEPLVVFACVKVGTKYPTEHVNILVDMIRRNLPEGFKARFLCLTDDPEGLDPGIDVAFCPPGFVGWWAKLFLFSPKLFPANARVIYFDLDTIIRGQIDVLLSYRGPLAMLRDFYQPEHLGSGVMLWRAGERPDILEAYIRAGMPIDEPGGDQAFIETVRPNALRLQDLFPGLICSYKADCHPNPPAGATVVCFHGFPGPKDASAPWVAPVWKKGGASLGRVHVECNTADEVQFANVAKAAVRGDVLFAGPLKETRQTLMICGGGPSLRDSLPEILIRAQAGAAVWALNGAAKLLLDAGVKVDAQVILDARPKNAAFMDARASLRLVASVCAETVIDAAVQAGPTMVFHPLIEGIDRHIPGNAHLIGGGVTVGMTAMMLAHVRGYRFVALYGYDSSYEGDRHHAYEQHLTKEEAQSFPVTVDGAPFVTNAVMYAQAKAFPDVARALSDAGMTITVHGAGLLPAVAAAYQAQIAALEEKAA